MKLITLFLIGAACYAAQVPLTPFTFSDGSVAILPNACTGQFVQSVNSDGTVNCGTPSGSGLPVTYTAGGPHLMEGGYNPAVSSGTQFQWWTATSTPTFAAAATGSFINSYMTANVNLSSAAHAVHFLSTVSRNNINGDGTGICDLCYPYYGSSSYGAGLTTATAGTGTGVFYAEGLILTGTNQTIDRYSAFFAANGPNLSNGNTVTHSAWFSGQAPVTGQPNFAGFYCCGPAYNASGIYGLYVENYAGFFKDELLDYAQRASSGTPFVCIDTTGKFVKSATACSGT